MESDYTEIFYFIPVYGIVHYTVLLNVNCPSIVITLFKGGFSAFPPAYQGWGDITQRLYETIQLLRKLLAAPDSCSLETFIGTILMVFNIVIFLPHGYFAQANALGYSNTGG
ncbi:Sucrose synthase [Platanthera zijinensis]|uniref:sucrose synthase n=1 Tax=Platanthera zijinensis TaxID=2320716 RepID=A0AAP0B3S0_9ASPA